MSTEEIARRLAAHPRWTWCAGMLALGPEGWARVGDFETRAYRDIEYRGSWPDLGDPATQGCLLMMLRQARPHVRADWSDVEDRAEVRAWDVRRWVRTWGARRAPIVGRSRRPGEALALALLAAWGEEVGDG